MLIRTYTSKYKFEYTVHMHVQCIEYTPLIIIT